MTTQLLLAFEPILVHCFACPHTVEAFDPVAAHNAMEAHYTDRHQPLIDRLVGMLA